MIFKCSFPTRWADFDPNNHMRHSAYNDYAAEARVRLFKKFGLTMQEFERLKIGPILFQENTKFFKEITMGDDISVEVLLLGVSEKGERFKFRHHIYRGDGKLAAEIEILGAWLDLNKRKLTVPPRIIIELAEQLNRTKDFEIIPVSKK
ncbi:MAG: thioesterase [Flavobacteriales bacterium]|nr:thioesterase [Flavobacteriales bacterium]